MREIKFRAYDTVLCRFLEDTEFIIDGSGYAEQLNPDTGDYAEMPDTTHIVQFTGLKDKNGKEIYEGYIVKLDSMFKTKGVVVFSNAEFWIDAKPVGGIQSEFYQPDGQLFSWHKLEIIGNIYENPELLEKK